MSLRILLVINREPVEEIVIVRIEKFRGTDEIHRYRVKHDDLPMGHLNHLFSDGALVLSQKALELVNERLDVIWVNTVDEIGKVSDA